MLATDLQKALNEPSAEIPIPIDAVGDAGSSRALGHVLRLKISASDKQLRKALPFMKKAVRLMNEHQYREAAVEGLKALDINDKIALANHVTAIALDKMGCAALALQMYERALELDPTDPELYQNLGLLAWRMELFDVAEKFFRIFMRMMPEAIEGPNNLACVLRDKGDFSNAIEVLRAAIYANQDSALLWNSLGTVMMEQTEFDQSVLFYEEALRHEPELARAYHNIGYCRATEGRHDAALEAFDEALKLGMLTPGETCEVKHAKASSLIATGQLKDGWELYRIRHEPRYSKATLFQMNCPRWDGQPLEGQNVIVVGEQGLGDEVMFANLCHDLIDRIGPDGSLTIAVTPRLMPLFERSFPMATVTRHATIRSNGVPLRGCPEITDWERYDLWAPLGDFLTVLRDNVSKYPKTMSFLTPDPDRVAHWHGELSALGPGLKCGLLWKSLLMSARRSKYYSPFEQWRETLKTPGVTFVNLQYGDCDADLKRARDEFGVTVHQMPGIDLRNDLDDLAALCAAMDQVVGPMNATTNIAAACGTPTAIIGAPDAWPYLGTGQLPWYPAAEVFSTPTLQNWTPAMKAFEQHLKMRVESNQKGAA